MTSDSNKGFTKRGTASLLNYLRYGSFVSDQRQISLAIAVYNRPSLIHSALKIPLREPRINDIVIHDDGSSVENYEEMARSLYDLSPKIRIERVNSNRGPFHAKFHAVQRCKNPWVILLDSDNSIDRRYVNALYRITPWEEDTIYCPEFAKPSFDFRDYADMEIDLEVARRLFIKDNPRFIATLLNTGNYFLNRDRYVSCLQNYIQYGVRSADVLTANYLWMKMGAKLYIVSGLAYNHLVHERSNFRNSKMVGKENVRLIKEGIVNQESVNFKNLGFDD